MRRQFSCALCVIALLTCVSYARQAEPKKTSGAGDVVGIWNGTWEGGSTGKFEMTISKGPDGKLTGTLAAHPEGGDGYTTGFKSVDVSGGKLTVTLEDPQGEVRITLEGSLDSTGMKGSYSVRTKAQGEEVEGGTWQAKKK